MRKKMYKSKKHWVVVSVVGLSFLGGTTVAADTTLVNINVSPTTHSTDLGNVPPTTPQVVSDTSPQATDVVAQGNILESSTEVVSQSENISTDKASDLISNSLVNTTQEDSISSSTENTVIKTVSDQVIQKDQTIVTTETLVQDQPLSFDSTQVTLASVASTPATTASVSGKTLTIQYNGEFTPTDSLKFAVWSDGNGQDDLVWYPADATAAAYIDLSKHKSLGLYHIHTYNKNGGLNAMTVTVPSPEVVTEVVKNQHQALIFW